MSRPGRALLAQMRDLARETPERVVERIRARKAGEQAHREAVARFGAVTPENAREFLAWQDARIRELITDEDNP